ncbi:hypothetical protein BDV39DRAFT_199164 [Aspergillus sergii]|uniref:C2H2-type domain-containing protein n=1 Tax=Aspergillus sergii TaxID=1034303 RepID=A0A5N6XMW1_9EURO|nr:hypothetical protein BDV39DRAFT_199164 [Aspergillus sergii]
MQFKLSALTALLAASASVYADGISGSKVTNILKTLTKGARDLNSSLQSTQDTSSVGQTIVSGEQKAMAEKQDAILSLAAEGDRRVTPKDQSAVCQSLLTYFKAEQELLLTIIEKRDIIQFPLGTAPIATALDADQEMTDLVSYDVMRKASICSDDVQNHYWVMKGAFTQASVRYTLPTNPSTNYLTRHVVERLSICSPDQDPTKIPFYRTSTEFTNQLYGKCAKEFKRRLGLPQCDRPLFVLRNVVMSPFPTDNDFISTMVDYFLSVVEDGVRLCRKRNASGPVIHRFVMQGTDEIFLAYQPSLHLGKHRQQIILAVELEDHAKSDYIEIRESNPQDPIFLKSSVEIDLQQVVSECERGSPVSFNGPEDYMPFYLYGYGKQWHISHMLLQAPNATFSAGNVKLDDRLASSLNQGHAEKKAILALTEVPETSIQPFPTSKSELPACFFFQPTRNTRRSREPVEGTVTLSKEIHIDLDWINKYPFEHEDRVGKLRDEFSQMARSWRDELEAFRIQESGGSTSDTAFRKTWDREEYAKKAADEESKRKEESKARYEAKLLGKKWHAPVDYSSLEATTSRKQRLDVASMVGKTTIVSAGSAVGKRGRGAGFYCGDCDLTFKDNLQLVEHLNSKQHLIATGQSGEVTRATVEDVRQRLRLLAHQKRVREEEERRAWQLDLGARLQEREEQEAKEREEKRRKRNEKRRKGGDGIKQEDDSWEGRLGIIA